MAELDQFKDDDDGGEEEEVKLCSLFPDFCKFQSELSCLNFSLFPAAAVMYLFRSCSCSIVVALMGGTFPPLPLALILLANMLHLE